MRIKLRQPAVRSFNGTFNSLLLYNMYARKVKISNPKGIQSYIKKMCNVFHQICRYTIITTLDCRKEFIK